MRFDKHHTAERSDYNSPDSPMVTVPALIGLATSSTWSWWHPNPVFLSRPNSRNRKSRGCKRGG
jgi:hypothetical protein